MVILQVAGVSDVEAAAVVWGDTVSRRQRQSGTAAGSGGCAADRAQRAPSTASTAAARQEVRPSPSSYQWRQQESTPQKIIKQQQQR